jgi:hypothetical protein
LLEFINVWYILIIISIIIWYQKKQTHEFHSQVEHISKDSIDTDTATPKMIDKPKSDDESFSESNKVTTKTSSFKNKSKIGVSLIAVIGIGAIYAKVKKNFCNKNIVTSKKIKNI